MKVCNACDILLIKQSQDQCNMTMPSAALERRRAKFMRTFCCVQFTWLYHIVVAFTLTCIDL